ncbi:hypothetical protein AAU61_19735 [Desulfocarbo indianensis]|nr:hypothetical protein AAU61_19735 [Desulfocarbo indianensis]
MLKRLDGWVGSFLIILFAIALLFAAVEGAASIWLLASRARPAGELAERVHTKYDKLLGWANVPNSHHPDMYGPGVALTINSQGLRAERDYAEQPPEGKVRVVCSGDSFTMGYGVADRETWPAQLEAMHPRLQTVNMGQGGYGLDQTYLWYRRDGGRLGHSIHLKAFITPDIQRMSFDAFMGYPKPWLALENGQLIERNVPVPGLPYLAPILVRYRHAIAELRIIQLLAGAVPSTFKQGQPTPVMPLLGNEVAQVAHHCLVDLKRRAEQEGAVFAAVWLPMKREHTNDSWDGFRAALKEKLASQGVPVIDLVEAFRQRVPPGEVEALFISGENLHYTGAEGHFTAGGNQFFAELILEHLLALEPASSLLN